MVAGVLSGTSADGIDVALVRFPPREPDAPAADRGGSRARERCPSPEAWPGGLGPPRLVAFATRPFPEAVRAPLRRMLDGRAPGVPELARLHRELGLAFGGAAREVADEAGGGLDLVGSHGQTVFHHDGEGPRATLQLGDGDFVAEAARCAVASDFRQRDLAAGGEGAPLAGLVDPLLFAAAELPAAVLNLGGMANLTLLDEVGRTVLAFDTGPAGSLLDGLARRGLDRPFDDGGATAARGRPCEALVEELLEHGFHGRAPPKSTGRDTFGEAWVERVAARGGELGARGADDLLASGVEYVARHVVEALGRAPTSSPAAARPRAVYVCGGGVHNAALLGALARRASVPVRSSAAAGVDPDAREALVFAVLGARCALGIPSTSPASTGAAPGRVLGKLSAAPPELAP